MKMLTIGSIAPRDADGNFLPSYPLYIEEAHAEEMIKMGVLKSFGDCARPFIAGMAKKYVEEGKNKLLEG